MPQLVSEPSTSTLLNSTPHREFGGREKEKKSERRPASHPSFNIETKILNNNMNPFQFKSSIFSRFRSFPMLHRFHPLSRPLVRVECLLLRCINIVCWRTKNVYYPLHPYPLSFPVTGMETGFHIMGNSENIGSNIIFSSELHAMAKRLHKRKSEVE